MLTRFAPSPTGLLHIGNARTALICRLSVAKNNGKMLLRIDDTDASRCSITFENKIKEHLSLLGIDWSQEIRQSARISIYDEFFNMLLQKTIIYPCYETKEDLEIRRKLLAKSGKPPVYKRKDAIKENNNSPVYRFDAGCMVISWNDGVRGNITVDLSHISDPIIKRADGSYTYMFPSVIDDMTCKITDVIRGEDHLTNTAVQIGMFQSLNAEIPRFCHTSLMYADDSKISKREGGSDLQHFFESGFEPAAIASYLVYMGTASRVCVSSFDELVSFFDISAYGSAPARFDINELIAVNRDLMKKLNFSQVEDRFLSKNMNVDENFWNTVRCNMSKFSESEEWYDICMREVEPLILDKDFATMIADLLEREVWDTGTWKRWVESIKSSSGIVGSHLFLPIRSAITGKKSGPNLQEMFYLIGRERVLLRLRGVKA